MDSYSFTLILDGPDVLLPEHFERLDEYGCTDASFGTRDGVQYADFDREAGSYVEAVISAIDDVERAVPSIWVVRVEAETLVGISDIAVRVDCTREYVRLLAEGKRGPGNFPAPRASLGGNRALWEWHDVAAWFRNVLRKDVAVEPHASDTRAINAMLEYERASQTLGAGERSHLAQWAIRRVIARAWRFQMQSSSTLYTLLRTSASLGPSEIRARMNQSADIRDAYSAEMVWAVTLMRQARAASSASSDVGTGWAVGNSGWVPPDAAAYLNIGVQTPTVAQREEGRTGNLSFPGTSSTMRRGRQLQDMHL